MISLSRATRTGPGCRSTYRCPPSRPTYLPPSVSSTYLRGGAWVGGSLIYKALLANPGLSDYAPFDFYRHQATTGVKQWRAFVIYLRTLDFSAEQTQRAGDSAVATFRQFERLWQ